MILLLLSFWIVTSSLSFAGEPSKIPPKEGDIGEFFWRPATKDVVRLLHNRMNESADPCDDFYEFACGNYGNKEEIIPDKEIKAKVDSYIEDFILHRMKTIKGSKVLNSVNKLMQSCLNYEKFRSMNEIYLKFAEFYDPMPLKEALADMAQFDIQTTFRAEVLPLSREEIIFMLGAPSIMPTSYPWNEEVIQEITKDKTLADKVLSFTNRILNTIASGEKATTYKPQTLDVDEIFESIGKNLSKNPKAKVGDFFVVLDKLINETEEEVVRAHAYVTFALTMAVAATDGNKTRGVNDKIKFSNNASAREVECGRFILGQFPLVVLTMVASELLPAEVRGGIHEMFTNIINEMEKMLKKQEWLGETRLNAIKKLKEGEMWLGLPDKLSNYKELDNILEAFEVDPNRDFVHQMMEMFKSKQTEKVALLNKSYSDVRVYKDQNDLFRINAWNEMEEDLSVYTMSILQSPFFNYRFPAFYKYGILGVMYGHEHGHGLADNKTLGPYFSPTDAINQTTRDEFTRRSGCLVAQVNKETLVTLEGREHKLKGSQYVDEIIADNQGFRVAFKAFRKAMKAIKHPKLLAEFKLYSAEKLFFVSTAQSFCATIDEDYWMGYANDLHPPGPTRVNALKNNGDFAKAFKCPVGSKMNPKDKCIFWD